MADEIITGKNCRYQPWSKQGRVSKTGIEGQKISVGPRCAKALRICETDPTYLNPYFAELTMKWPLGWTDLKAIGNGQFSKWLEAHSES
ncbi:hypothetical protein [Acinetobacter baumannii]|uniref:hypothetical protein n=1 Tax=Acinetobacter baumannii TaxID=470 RepID=UPI00108002B1|nr:hypothetical protein [Acinetobacter baumannii]QBY16352.1 hypothetical protein E4664_20490 [Acinetobacter baumannii]